MVRKPPALDRGLVTEVDRELQDFLFAFLPELVNELTSHVGTGFSQRQEDAVSGYFQQITTLTNFFSSPQSPLGRSKTYKHIRSLHRRFTAFCEVRGPSRASVNARRIARDRIEDELGSVVRKYSHVNNPPTSPGRKRSLENLKSSLELSVGYLKRIGLDSIDQFVEWRNIRNDEIVAGSRADVVASADRQHDLALRTRDSRSREHISLDLTQVRSLARSATRAMRAKDFLEWAGGRSVMLAIVFTDIVDATKLEHKIGREKMNEVRSAHFKQGYKLIQRHGGRTVKTMGDGLMVALHSADTALDFALELQTDPGCSDIQIRAGIHVGSMSVVDNDVFGLTVSFAARVASAAKGAEIWLSSEAKEAIQDLRAGRHGSLHWLRHDNIELKGFQKTTLWSISGPSGKT